LVVEVMLVLLDLLIQSPIQEKLETHLHLDQYPQAEVVEEQRLVIMPLILGIQFLVLVVEVVEDLTLLVEYLLHLLVELLVHHHQQVDGGILVVLDFLLDLVILMVAAAEVLLLPEVMQQLHLLVQVVMV
jgi:hypothetical protein